MKSVPWNLIMALVETGNFRRRRAAIGDLVTAQQ